MVRPFSVAAAPTIVFGVKKRFELTNLIKKYGRSIVLVTGSKSFLTSEFGKEMISQLAKDSIQFVSIKIDREPTPEDVDKAVDALRSIDIDVVIAIGGGSVIDAGKAIAAMIYEEGSVTSYLEGIGDKQPSGKTKPFIAVPTTSGTGSEATKNAVISSVGKKGFKKSLRHDNYIPSIALIDPELTLSCSKELTAASGMDAFTQLLESYLSNNASIFTDSLALKALGSIKIGLKKAVNDADDIEARTNLSYAAMVSGVTLANAGLGTVHGYASAIGGFFDIPHGTVCGTLMGETNRVTVSKIKQTSEGIYALNKYAQVGKLFAGHHSKSEDYYIDFLLTLIDDYTDSFGIKKLREYNIHQDDIKKIIEVTGNKNNPVILNKEELAAVLETRL